MDAIILAGGQSMRLGRDKAWETLGGEPLLARVVRRLAAVFPHVIVVRPAGPLPALPAGVSLVKDDLPGYGPPGAIWSGLGRIRGDRAFVVACDMPFVNADLAQALFQRGDRAPVVLPLIRGKTEPLHAVYSKACRPLLLASVARGNGSLQSALARADSLLVGEEELRALDPELRSFFNVNTADDLRVARELLALTEPAGPLATASNQGAAGDLPSNYPNGECNGGSTGHTIGLRHQVQPTAM
ncbi:MAG: molybdenum cofactor guanylyltransferase [Chloroflexi bacterium]|nr:molybdenum cofactor guanylyltransferase [Chloroflexota bacterium]